MRFLKIVEPENRAHRQPVSWFAENCHFGDDKGEAKLKQSMIYLLITDNLFKITKRWHGEMKCQTPAKFFIIENHYCSRNRYGCSPISCKSDSYRIRGLAGAIGSEAGGGGS